MNGGISETPAAGIGKLLMDNRFAVPNHQRDYSWTEDEVKQLFDDVEFALEKRNPVYFCGLVVFQQSPDGTLVVLDGQQRLATVLIIFSAIRSWLQQYTNSQKDAAQIQEWFIGRSELGETELHPRLTMNSANDHAFNEYIIQSISPVDIKKSLSSLKKQDRNRRMLEAAAYAHHRISQIAEHLNSKDDTAKYLLDLVKYLRDKVSVVQLTVASESAAYTIFETLNDRGLDLSPLDLVKNHLFSKADEYSPARVRDMEERWAQMMSTLSNVRSDNFLKAFWTSRHGRIRTTDLFDAFKKQYGTADTAISLSMDLLASSEQYAALESSDDPVWAPYSTQTRSIVRDLKVVGSQQAHPVILSALARLEISEVERLLRLLEVVIVRYLLVGGGNTGRFETTCARLARSIFQKEVITISKGSYHRDRGSTGVERRLSK